MGTTEFNSNAIVQIYSGSRMLTDPVERLCDPIPPNLRGEGIYEAINALWDFHSFDDGKSADMFSSVGGIIKRNVYLFAKYQEDFDLGYQFINTLAAWIVLDHYDIAPYAESWTNLKPTTLDLLDNVLAVQNRNPTPIMADIRHPEQRNDPFYNALTMMIGLRNETLLRNDAITLRRHGYGAPFTQPAMQRLTTRHRHAMRILTDTSHAESNLALSNRQFAHAYVTNFRMLMPRHKTGLQLVHDIT